MGEKQNQHILFVDDEIYTRDLVKESVEALTEAGYVVWQADSEEGTEESMKRIIDEKVPLSLLIVDGLGGRCDAIINLVRLSFPDLTSLLFSTSNYGYGNSLLMKQAIESDGTQVLVDRVRELINK